MDNEAWIKALEAYAKYEELNKKANRNLVFRGKKCELNRQNFINDLAEIDRKWVQEKIKRIQFLCALKKNEILHCISQLGIKNIIDTTSIQEWSKYAEIAKISEDLLFQYHKEESSTIKSFNKLIAAFWLTEWELDW